MVDEEIVQSADDAVTCAQAFGFPIVLKGLGATLSHKTELNIVRLGLANENEVRTAFDQVQDACGSAWEGCLIQPMISGSREFVAGLIQDPQFGPTIMFGLGGIFTEAFEDVVFRIAPITSTQALDMVEELKSRKLLGAFRGEAAVNKEQLAQALVGLSKLGVEHSDIKEVDINPLIVSSDGTVTAVDGLVVLTGKEETPAALPETRDIQKLNTDIHAMMYPESIAVIGVPRTPLGSYPGIYRCMRDFGYKGRLYPINPGADEIDGAKAYPNLKALPEKVDLVILSIGSDYVCSALEECIETGNRNVHIFTSGFAETGEEEGILLQEKIKSIAEKGNLNIVGPNCMGIHVPKVRTLTWKNAATESGPVSMVSQSGGNAQDFGHIVNRLGLYFSKIISYGNAVNMDSTDFLEYLEQDEETQTISLYIEGVKDGRRLLDQVTRINSKKPIVIMKGGMTESGARTVASHTGSLAGGQKIWDGFFKQTGAVRADSLEEMGEAVCTMNLLPEVKGKGVVILGTGGGIGVAAADSCARAGLEMPELTPEVMEKLREYIPPAGNMIKNPIDAHIVIMKLELMGPTLKLLSNEPDLDMFILSFHLDWIYGLHQGGHIDAIVDYLTNDVQKYLNGKPLAVAWRQYQPIKEIQEARARMEKGLQAAGIPYYEGLDRALNALSKAADYYEFQNKYFKK